MLTLEQIKGARAMLGWSAKELSERAGIGVATIQRMEIRGPGTSTANNLQAVKESLEKAGIEFIPENGGGPGVRLRKDIAQ